MKFKDFVATNEFGAVYKGTKATESKLAMMHVLTECSQEGFGIIDNVQDIALRLMLLHHSCTRLGDKLLVTRNVESLERHMAALALRYNAKYTYNNKQELKELLATHKPHGKVGNWLGTAMGSLSGVQAVLALYGSTEERVLAAP